MNNAASNDYIRAIVIFKHRTESAILIASDGEEHWVPRSCISWSSDCKVNTLKRNDEFELSIVEWKASEIGLQY